jgi:hypothetical protein
MTMTRKRWVLLVEWAMIGACSASPAEPASETSSTSDDTTGEQSDAPSPSTTSSATGPGTTANDDAPQDESSSDATSSPATGTSGPPAPSCDPVVPGEYNACLGPQNTAACNWIFDPEATGSLTCITALAVENGSVCTITDCVDRCDCFAHPGTGTATVECMDGVIEGNTACVLFCGGGEVCPDGMECSYNICVAPPA